MISPGNLDSELTVGTIYLPAGVSFNSSAYTIDGTPRVTNWAPNEESRKFEIPVEVKNPNGSKVNKVIEIIVQRDPDRDGDPDVTNLDDDNDGVTDVEEIAKGSNPKDVNSKPAVAPPANNGGANGSRGRGPNTVDDSNLLGYTGFTAMSGAALTLLALKKKKEEEEE